MKEKFSVTQDTLRSFGQSCLKRTRRQVRTTLKIITPTGLRKSYPLFWPLTAVIGLTASEHPIWGWTKRLIAEVIVRMFRQFYVTLSYLPQSTVTKTVHSNSSNHSTFQCMRGRFVLEWPAADMPLTLREYQGGGWRQRRKHQQIQLENTASLLIRPLIIDRFISTACQSTHTIQPFFGRGTVRLPRPSQTLPQKNSVYAK
jgi:hypothetical protein